MTNENLTEEIWTEEDIQQMREFIGANPDLTWTPHYAVSPDISFVYGEKNIFREMLELVDKEVRTEIPESDLQTFSDLVEGATITRNAND